MPDSRPRPRGEIRVARIISRLNVGGPAIQAITLTRELESRGYRTLLLRGSEGPREGSMDDLADELGVRPVRVARMRREIGPQDVPALLALIGHLRRFRPHIVHTHAAKAGTLGRLAALAPGVGRPRLVHTFHGHSLTGYWSGARNRVLLEVERRLARRTDRLVAVSPEVRDELVELGVAPASSFSVVPVGFDLSRFLVDGEERSRRRAALRAELGIPAEAPLVTLIARLVPIKRVDRFLRVAVRVAAATDARFLIVGDGELHDELRSSADARRLDGGVVWAGMRRDVPDVCFASDVVALTSDNEGTPVSLIEAQAAGVPVVATRVGGAASVVAEPLSGRLADPGDEPALAGRLVELLDAPAAATQMGAHGRTHALSRFSLRRLVDDVDSLYRGVLAGRA